MWNNLKRFWKTEKQKVFACAYQITKLINRKQIKQITTTTGEEKKERKSLTVV